MALDATLEGLRSRILDSIKGRKIGLDPSGFLLGILGEIQPIQSLTSNTTGTTVPNYGIARIDTTAGSSFSLQAPMPGVSKTLCQMSTGGAVITLASGTFLTSLSSTQTFLTFGATYANLVRLLGLSTSVYMLGGALSTGVTIA